jgi:hypothetical protein
MPNTVWTGEGQVNMGGGERLSNMGGMIAMT